MPSESRNIPEQEASIKSRAHELFVKPEADEGTRATKPFLVYLRETPAFPMSSTVKAMLWFAGIIVGLLFLAAVWKLSLRYGPRQQSPRAAPATRSAGLNPRRQIEAQRRNAVQQPGNARAISPSRPVL
jgi:hypothetical protein